MKTQLCTFCGEDVPAAVIAERTGYCPVCHQEIRAALIEQYRCGFIEWEKTGRGEWRLQGKVGKEEYGTAYLSRAEMLAEGLFNPREAAI